MTVHATGTFDVTITPLDDDTAETLGRMRLTKRFQGDLNATSIGTTAQ